MKCEVIFDVDTKREKLKLLEQESGRPDFWDDQENAQKNFAEGKVLRSTLQPLDEASRVMGDMDVMVELAELSDDKAEAKGLADELNQSMDTLDHLLDQLELRALLGGQLDTCNAFISLHAGAGGTESCDWAAMLFRMYSRYAERHGFSVSILDYLPGDEAGIKSVTALISGEFAYGYLKGERGVHRLVRISPFDSNARRHTSFVAMDVIAEVDDDVDIEIVDSDLRVDTYRASGAGGQHINTTDSAIRITHMPTNIVVQCQAERSQHKNRSTAMKMLKAKLYEYEMDKKRQEMEKYYGEKGEMAWGRQIRSYVMQPYTMVKDHRTNEESGNVDGVMDGDIERFIEAYLKYMSEKK